MVMSDKLPVISIDFKTRKRIRIHKTTLHLLEDPDYIQLLINPTMQIIAVRKGNYNDPLSLRVDCKKIVRDSFELNSKELLHSLLMVYDSWEDGCSYRITGSFDDKNQVAQFNICDMKRIRRSL